MKRQNPAGRRGSEGHLLNAPVAGTRTNNTKFLRCLPNRIGQRRDTRAG